MAAASTVAESTGAICVWRAHIEGQAGAKELLAVSPGSCSPLPRKHGGHCVQHALWLARARGQSAFGQSRLFFCVCSLLNKPTAPRTAHTTLYPLRGSAPPQEPGTWHLVGTCTLVNTPHVTHLRRGTWNLGTLEPPTISRRPPRNLEPRNLEPPQSHGPTVEPGTSEPRNPRRGGGTWNLGMDSKKKSARLWRAGKTWNLEPTGTYSQRGRGTRTAEPRKG